MSRFEIIQKVRSEKVVVVIRMRDSRNLLSVVEAVLAGGLSVMEVTMNTPNALQLIEKARATFGDELTFGVGSVLDKATTESAINYGAQFVVSPVCKPEIIHTSHRYDAPVMPGCFSPTEILQAHEQGADIIKVFPAGSLGMAFLKAIKAPMPQLNLMPAVGVNLTNAGEWIKAGACAVGIGDTLLDEQVIADGNWAKLKENVETLRTNLNASK